MSSWQEKLTHYDAVQVENMWLKRQVVRLESNLKKALKPNKKNYQKLLDEMPTDVDRYIHAVNAIYGVSLAELQSPSRVVLITQARQVLYFMLNKDLCISTTRVGRLLNRDHSTVMYGVKVAERRFQSKINDVREIMK